MWIESEGEQEEEEEEVMDNAEEDGNGNKPNKVPYHMLSSKDKRK